jgi:chemotaxis response regulator CheB
MATDKPLTAIVCDADRWARETVSELVSAGGFEIVGETEHAIEAIRQSELLHPALVVIAHELEGVSGLEAISDLHVGDDPPEVILVAVGADGRDQAKASGAFEVAVKGDLDMLSRMLVEVHDLIETGERRTSVERRRGPDRRKAQDWSKVTHERRSGGDRRGQLRRDMQSLARSRKLLEQGDDERLDETDG